MNHLRPINEHLISSSPHHTSARGRIPLGSPPYYNSRLNPPSSQGGSWLPSFSTTPQLKAETHLKARNKAHMIRYMEGAQQVLHSAGTHTFSMFYVSMFYVKQGTIKFILNASIKSLPTMASLKRWKKIN